MNNDIENLKIILNTLDPTSELYKTLDTMIAEKVVEKGMDVKDLIFFNLLMRGIRVESNIDTGITTVIRGDEMWDFTIPLKLGITNEQYKFLCELRRNGITNMFNAGKYISNEFEIPLQDSNEILKVWMDKFTEEDY